MTTYTKIASGARVRLEAKMRDVTYTRPVANDYDAPVLVEATCADVYSEAQPADSQALTTWVDAVCAILEDVVSHYSPVSDALNRCYKRATGGDISYWNHELAVAARMRLRAQDAIESQPVLLESSVPIDMILHCPACGEQHIDDIEPGAIITDCKLVGAAETWTNPPHRSHLCSGCGHIWRPADVPTNGVAEIKTKGKNDSPEVAFSAESEAQGYALEAIHQFCPELRFREDGQTLLTPVQVETILRRMGWTPLSERRGSENRANDPVAAAYERCAVAAWNHYMDVCKARGLPANMSDEWCAAKAIRALR